MALHPHTPAIKRLLEQRRLRESADRPTRGLTKAVSAVTRLKKKRFPNDRVVLDPTRPVELNRPVEIT